MDNVIDDREYTNITVVDAELEDVYDKVDIYLNKKVDANEVIDLDAVVDAVENSEGTKQLTDMIGAAIAQDETVHALMGAEDGDDSTTFFRSGVYYENGKSISIGSKLREGLKVTAAISNDAHNPNFPNAQEENWQALSIRFDYATTVKTL